MELVSMVQERHLSHTSPSAAQSVGCSGVKHNAAGAVGGMSSRVTNHASSGNLINKSGLANARRTVFL